MLQACVKKKKNLNKRTKLSQYFMHSEVERVMKTKNTVRSEVERIV